MFIDPRDVEKVLAIMAYVAAFASAIFLSRIALAAGRAVAMW